MHKAPHEYDPEYNRRLLIAFSLICLLMGLWYYFYELPHRRQLDEQKLASLQAVAQKEQLKNAEEPVLLENQKLKTTLDKNEKKPREEVVTAAPRLKISSTRLHGSLNLKGARLDDLTLAGYKQTLAKNSPEVVLLSPPGTEEPAVIEIGWIAADKNINTPNPDTVWQAESDGPLTPEHPVTLAWDNGQGLKFIIKFSLDENYMFQIEQVIENKSSTKVSFYPYALISKAEPKLDKPPIGVLHTGPLGVMDHTLTEVSYKDLREETKKEFPNSTGWIGITDKYWAKALIPQEGDTYKANFRYSIQGTDEKFQVDYLGDEKSVEPGSGLTYNSKIFAGAKELKILEKYRDQYHIPLFERLIDFGWFYFLSKPMMHALIYFYSLLGNFGLAILLLTFCVKLLLFPLARKSYISMGRIRELSPKIQALRERYKDDKMEIQKKTMELYKKEKVNPASGCLPILLQMPIFFALYKVFYVSLEMRHTPFFGWVKDLSAPDPTSFVNLFGLLPFNPPGFLLIGAWPFLWAATMYVQQKISPPIPDPLQAKMMKLMPVFLGVIFATMPAGLVIYWTFSNLLTICQQLYFLKFHGTKVRPGEWKD